MTYANSRSEPNLIDSYVDQHMLSSWKTFYEDFEDFEDSEGDVFLFPTCIMVEAQIPLGEFGFMMLEEILNSARDFAENFYEHGDAQNIAKEWLKRESAQPTVQAIMCTYEFKTTNDRIVFDISYKIVLN